MEYHCTLPFREISTDVKCSFLISSYKTSLTFFQKGAQNTCGVFSIQGVTGGTDQTLGGCSLC